MDPDATLNEIRELIVDFNDTSKSLASRNISLETMAEKFQALDTWLNSGGFLPRSWDLSVKRGVDHEEIWCGRCDRDNEHNFVNGKCLCCGKEKS